MRNRTSVSKLALILSWLSALVIVLLPFHAFLTVWLASAIDNYTLLRLWKELLLLVISAGSAYLLVKDARLREKVFASRLTQLVAFYALISVLWGVAAYLLDKVTLKAVAYGLLVNLRFLIFFLCLWITATKSQWLRDVWLKILVIPATIVIFIGLLQWLVLPYDVLKHFGYNSQTIFPYQTINYDINYPRVMSTLRGANPLGAYLVVILSVLAVSFLKTKRNRWLVSGFGFFGLLVLFFSYSRGAWIGLTLSLIALAWITLRPPRARSLVLTWLVGFLAVGLIAIVAFWNHPTFKNYFFHTNDSSTIEESSNEAHVSAFKGGLSDLVTEPLGRGVGTAGPASIYSHDVRLSENYFTQIGQELGWLGLAVFLAINFLVGRELWFRRNDNLSSALFITIIGLTVVNMVSHAWTDDTLAYIWWGLAGIALAPAILTDRKHKQHAKNHKKTT